MKASDINLVAYLQHILDSIQRINSYVEGVSFNEFAKKTIIQDAVVRNMEIMGEASNNIKKLFPEYASNNEHIPLADVYGMRCSLSHGYFDVSEEVVWNTIQDDLPELEKQIQDSLEALNNDLKNDSLNECGWHA